MRALVSWRRAAGVAAVALLVLPVGTRGQSSSTWPPERLQDTGLYADWASKTVDAQNLPFSPQYPLWSDGAVKRRWFTLPPGTWIDASDPDHWVYPVGTRVWKEFRFDRRAETRFIEHTAEGWQFAAYVWNEDETDAPLAPDRGISRSVQIREGVRHAIPSRADCRACHEASPVRLLGFGALQLSSDRDPNAPHAEPVPPGGVDLPALVAAGLVRNLPPRFIGQPPRIDAKTPTARAAIGYLHANCGSCHIGSGAMATLAFALNYPLHPATPGEPPALVTALGRPSKFRLPDGTDQDERVCAGRPDRSVLLGRMLSRNPVVQMPPLGTRVVDEDAVKLIRQWIAEDLATHTAVTQAGPISDSKEED